MKKFVVISVLILILASNFVFGEDKPWEKDFRGVPFGASEKEARQKIPNLDCSNSEKLGRVCHDMNFYIGNVKTFNAMSFKNDKMVTVFLSFKSENYDFIKGVFIKKYGLPTDTKNMTVKTMAGVEYENEILEWEGNKIILRLRKFGGKIDQGNAYFGDLSYMKGKIKEGEEKEKKAVTDF